MNIRTQEFILPGTGRKVYLQIDEDQSKFIQVYGSDIAQYKPSGLSWKDYYDWLNNWVNKATIDQVNDINREDVKMAWIKLKRAKVDSYGNLFISKVVPRKLHKRPLNITFNEMKFDADVSNGLIDQVKISMGLGLVPSIDSVNDASAYGRLPMLEFLASLDPPILPDINGANRAARNGEVDVLRFLSQQNPPILPDVNGANLAASTF